MMKMIDNVADYWEQRRRLKHKKIQLKNARLRAQGKEPLKAGWGSMVNTGAGGLNQDRLNRPEAVAEIQKQVANQQAKQH